jgi:CRP/FNR family transcriptional regulator, cyclic AMP receptor protein
MSAQGLLGTFESHAFLAALTERQRMLLATGARPFTAAPKELLAREGETAKTFFVLQQGHVALEIQTPKRGVVTLQTAAPGEIVGWSWLVPPHRWKFDCRAVDAVRGLAFDAEWLREKCEQDHELGYHLLKQMVIVIANRLGSMRMQSLDMYK